LSLGTQVGLGQGDIVLDGNPAPRGKGTAAAHFYLLYSNDRQQYKNNLTKKSGAI